MKLLEAKININDVFFHGSSEELINSIDKPSFLHPFYVTKDIHYAMAFCTKSQSNTGDWEDNKHSTFTPADSNFVYVVSLKPDTEFYDFRTDISQDDCKVLSKIIPLSVIHFAKKHLIKFGKNYGDIYEFIAQIIGDAIYPFFRFKGRYDSYVDDIDSITASQIGYLMTHQQFFDVGRMIASLNLSSSYDVHQTMAPILKRLHSMGYDGIITSEQDFNEDNAKASLVKTDYAIGIFDVRALDAINIIPMHYRWLKKITPIDIPANTTAKDKIRRYIQLYKKLSSKNK